MGLVTMKITYVQQDISLELNKGIASIAKMYDGHEILHDGLKINLAEMLPVKEFQAKQLNLFWVLQSSAR